MFGRGKASGPDLEEILISGDIALQVLPPALLVGSLNHGTAREGTPVQSHEGSKAVTEKRGQGVCPDGGAVRMRSHRMEFVYQVPGWCSTHLSSDPCHDPSDLTPIPHKRETFVLLAHHKFR